MANILNLKLATTSYQQFLKIGPFTINVVVEACDISVLDANQLASLLIAAQSGDVISVGQTQAAFITSVSGQTPAVLYPPAPGTAPQTQSVNLTGLHPHPFLAMGPYFITNTLQDVDFSTFSEKELENAILAIQHNEIQAAGLSEADFIAFLNALVAV